MARRAWAAFSAALVRRPLLTNMGVSGCTMSVGDLTAQAVEMRQRGEPFRFSSFKIDRTAIAIGWNTLLFTPIFLVWFRRLDRLFPGTGAQALKKVTVNQLIITVPINAGFLAYTTTVEAVLRSENMRYVGRVRRPQHCRGVEIPGDLVFFNAVVSSGSQ